MHPVLKYMKKFFYIIITLSIFSSCSEYQKVLKNEDIAPKFKMGEALYNDGKYEKANKLFAQIVPSYRGKPQAEKLMYLYSNTFYKTKDYYLAAYQFERFATSYPNSEKAEEASFLSAKSYYMLSPVYSKDQTETVNALEKLQAFINAYPESEFSEEANVLVKELDLKLETKAFEIAKQYNKIAFTSTELNAAIKSFDNFILDFPGSSLREDALFYRFDSAYKLAINSVEYKKQERLQTAKEYYESFKKRYKNSKHMETINVMASEIDESLQKYSTKS